MNTIHSVLAELRASSLDERDKGAKFEALTKKWLELSPEYSTLYDKVWFYGEWAKEQGLDQTDAGIDLVAQNAQDKTFVAIQCKFYADTQVIEKRHIDSFFTALNKKHFVSGVIVSVAKRWSKLADEALLELSKPVFKVGLHQFETSGVDWSDFALSDTSGLRLAPKKQLRPHQESALQAALANFQAHDRGKLIMACGSGKTYTSLKIAESMVAKGGKVLFLVPSIALLSQSLSEWKAQSSSAINAYAVCSDSRIGKSKENEDISYTDLAYPATTNASKLVKNFRVDENGLTVVFSTYQSIEVIIEAQMNGLPDFDLIVCDEAHRTTGVKISNVDESAFVKIHDKDLVLGKKRMYMTATPRIYGEQVKQKAQEADALLASMDDESIYGPEFYLLTFGQAVAEDLLSDYKVLVLAVSEEHVSRKLQGLLARDGELDIDDVTKIVGCYNGLRKISTNQDDFRVDPNPMRTAIAFSRSIKESKQLANQFQIVTQALADEDSDANPLAAEADHVDGTFNMEQRLDLLDWLKDSKTENTVRILSNARCLSEGIDVPALDAVLFMNPRDSQVDVVQSIGRVMRKAPGKQYGYVILPVVVKAGVSAEEALSDSKSYKTVWQVLQALRAHDSRFDAIVNKLELTGDNGPISVIGVGFDDGESESVSEGKQETLGLEPLFSFDDLHDAIMAKLVQKVGQRTYWETWAKDVSEIAKQHIQNISALVEDGDQLLHQEFSTFLKGLQDNLNPSVTAADAIEMLAQHLITKPVFDSLFEGYSFTTSNPVSISMNQMVKALESASMNTEETALAGFYESVRLRASGITDGAAKQKIIKELYERFFRLAFVETSDRLGIVYTPNEVVDYIIQSVDQILQSEFGVSLSHQGVHVLDPFTGTGTFITRLLQLGVIRPADLVRKYTQELHANEIVLLAYYVAAINVEETFHSLTQGEYIPFEGIVLTDSFQMTEPNDELDGLGVFPENNDRAVKQNALKIQVVIGNPPYSIGQGSENDFNQNLKYEHLDERIRTTYAAKTENVAKRSLYDAYIRAFRWASDRVGEQGVVCFVTNSSWLDGSATDGFRKSLTDEFSKIYVVNLRGNQRTQGEISRKEGGKVFGSGSRTPIAITVLVRNPKSLTTGQIFYHDIGDYLTREEKLSKLVEFTSVVDTPFTQLIPNESGDWLNQRDATFGEYIPLGDKAVKGASAESVFEMHSLGLTTNRDAWVYNFSKHKLETNVKRMIAAYNSEVEAIRANPNHKLSGDARKISWSRGLKKRAENLKPIAFNPDAIRLASYRPFMNCWVYFDKALNEDQRRIPVIFEDSSTQNLGIVISGAGTSSDFSAIVVDKTPDLQLLPNGSVFPVSYVDSSGSSDESNALFAFDSGDVWRSNISSFSAKHFSQKFKRELNPKEMVSFVFAMLNSPEYRTRYSSDLGKAIPRIPAVENFEQYISLGEEMVELFSGFEKLTPFELTVEAGANESFHVRKMKFNKIHGSVDKSTIIYNDSVRISGIPAEVDGFRIGGRSGLEWVLERYQIREDAASGILNDPNDWISSQGDPKWLVSHIGRVVTLSMEMQRLRDLLPSLKII
jgi:predicted helicase